MKKKNVNRLLAIVLGLGLSLGTVACGNQEAENEELETASVDLEAKTDLSSEDFNIDDVPEFTIRVGVTSGSDNQYLQILDDHTGFFKDRGINLETSEFAAGINTIDAITIGQLDIGNFADYAGINRIGNTLDETDLRAITLTGVNTSYNLYVNPEHIKTVDDLEGAVLLSQAGVVFEYDYGKLIETYNLDPDKVVLTNVNSAQEALALASTNSADSYWANSQIAPKFEEAGWVPLVNIGDVGAPMYGFLVASNSYLESHKEEVAKFLAVSEEGFAYIDENLDEFAGWVEAELGLKKDLVISGWTERTHDYTFTPDGYEDLKSVEEWCYKNGNFPTEFDPADFINTDSLALYKPEAVTWQAK